MLFWMEPMLRTDPQAKKPCSFCPGCGGELYASGGICLRCERRSP